MEGSEKAVSAESLAEGERVSWQELVTTLGELENKRLRNEEFAGLICHRFMVLKKFKRPIKII